MFLNKMRHWVGLAVAMALALSLMNILAFAATTVTVLDGNVSITDTATSMSESGGVVTVNAKGGYLSQTTNTITITNASKSTATLSFEYSASNYSSFSESSASGSMSVVLTADATITMSITGKKAISSNTATLTLSNFSLTVAAASSNVTFDFDSSLGSVTVDGESVADGDVEEIASSGVALVATPKSGATFLGWINGDTHQRLSADASYTLTPASDMTVIAAFASASSTAWFKVGSYMYDDLNDAATYASSSTNKVIIPMHDGTLPAGDYTIPSGVTLLIPYDSANTLCTTTPTVVDTGYTKPTAYRTLSMANGANIIVNGAISLSGTQCSQYRYNGQPTGPQGFIKMEQGSSITVNSNGALYVWGYIVGSGTVRAKSEATVYECFQVRDYRGGAVTSNMIDNSYKVFPLSQYYVQNIEVPLTLEAGAIEKGYFSVYVTLAGTQSAEIPFIGSSSMFQIRSGSITKDYDETTDRLVVDVNGTLEANPFSFSLKVVLLGSVTFTSSNYDLPLTNNITININDGSSFVVKQDLSMLPGSVINISENAVLSIEDSKRLIVYDSDQWGYYCSEHEVKWIALNYAYGRKYTRSESDLTDAKILVSGTLDASSGYLYSTEGGADICSTATGKAIIPVTSGATAYQAHQNTDEEIDEWTEFAITSAQLHNGGTENKYSGTDNEYTKTAGASEETTYNHCPDCLMWYTGSHACAAAATYSVTITWTQTSTATYTEQTTYEWDPATLSYSEKTTGRWTVTETVMTITVDNSKSKGAVTAEFVYASNVTGDTAWTGLTDNALFVAAGGNGNATLTVAPTGAPTKPASGSEIILGTISITLTKGGT